MGLIQMAPIHPDPIQRLAEDYKAIVNSISLHFSTHTSEPAVDVILKSATNLLNRRVDLCAVQHIQALTKAAFIVAPNTRVGRSEYTITFVDHKRSPNLDFRTILDEWCKRNPEKELPKVDLWRLNQKLPTKSNLSILDRSKVHKSLRNDSSKFQFQVKNEKTQRSLNKGLTLLERIRLKEQLKSSELQDRKMDSQYLIWGKMASAYGIIFQNYDAETKASMTFSFNKYMEIIQNSFKYPVTQSEIKDAIIELLRCLGPEKVQIVTKGNISVLKIHQLDRSKDLAKIQEFLDKKGKI